MILTTKEVVFSPIPEEMLKEAAKLAELQAKENVGNKTQAIKEDRDVTGNIGQFMLEMFLRKVQLFGSDFLVRPYEPGRYAGDVDDGHILQLPFDCKTSSGFVSLDVKDTVRVFDHQIEKRVPAYIFCHYAKGASVFQILGWCPYEYFRHFSFRVPKDALLFGEGSRPTMAVSHELEVRRLFPIATYNPDMYKHIIKHTKKRAVDILL